MDNNELLEAISLMIDKKIEPLQSDMQGMKADMSEIKDRTQRIEDRTLKLEVTIENETNRNIKLLMEAQSLNTEKLKEISTNADRIDKMETDLFAVKESTKHNKEEIEKLKIKIG